MTIAPNYTARMAMTDTDLAYLAGLFDGEGCVAKNSAERNYFLTLSNCERRLCELFLAFGGSVNDVTHTRRRIRPQYQWRATGAAMERARVALEPYLKVKRIPPPGTRYPNFEDARQQWLALTSSGSAVP